ncbi:hypothetical protein GGF46_005093 [Coemansia sp. RSA 552]|nr:hypothetical protein GGF46_005093 [Coemansia sp. RSA 552]
MPRVGVDKFVVRRERETPLKLSPGVFPEGRQTEWAEQNRTLAFTVHPLTSAVALAPAGQQAREHLDRRVQVYEQDQRVYVCGLSGVPDERLPFINDTHAVFVGLQSIMAAGVEHVEMDSLVRMSALYREAMLRQVRVLQDVASPTEFVMGEVDVFQSMHAVWHLVEIVYLSTNMPGLSLSIVPYYMEWLNFNFPSPRAEEGRGLVQASADADVLAGDPALWPYLKKLALRGHVGTLANMLERVAASQEISGAAGRWVRELARVSRDMPLGSQGETAGAFNARWRRWNGELQDMATAVGSLLGGGCDDRALEAAYAIIDVMRGSVDSISAMGDTWQDILGAVLLYSEPTAQADRLPGLALAVLEQFQMGEFTVLDRALVALLTHDLPEFLVYCAQIDGWLSAHLVDMMDHINILEICRRVFAVDPREHYLLSLGEAYLRHEDLWRVAIDYFGLSGTRAGLCLIEECVVRVPLNSERRAQQVLRVCTKYGLPNAKDRIHRQLGRQKWQRGRLGAAIEHFAQVADWAAIGQICDQLWSEYLESGKLTYGPIIDGVVGFKHERLQFLSQYRDFHESYRAGDYAVAAKTLLSILLNETAPAHAIPDLLVDSIPLLEGDQLVFTSDDTLELMRCAESLVQSPLVSKLPVLSPTTDPEIIGRDELSIFNVACARNLARSFVMS